MDVHLFLKLTITFTVTQFSEKSLPHNRYVLFTIRNELSNTVPGVIDSGIVTEREKFHFPRNSLRYTVGNITLSGLGEEWSCRSVSTFYCP